MSLAVEWLVPGAPDLLPVQSIDEDAMNEKRFDVLRKLLRPLSEAEVAALVHAQTVGSRGEHLSLADAGLEDEVRGFLAPSGY
jgi:hypothetical protein